MKTIRRQRSTSGFTLVEVLTVMAIIALLATLSSVSLTGMMRSNKITAAANLVSAELSHARTTAIARSNSTELRIYNSTTAPAIQTVEILNNGTIVPLTKQLLLPTGTVVASSTSFSGLLTLAAQTVPAGQNYAGSQYVAVLFSSTGVPRDPATGNALGTTNNYFTIVSSQNVNATTLPSNWITLTVDDRTGTIRRYQP